MSQHIHRGCGDDLVEAESEIRLEPSPEQPIELVEDKKRDEDRPEQSDDGCRDCAVGQDGRNDCGQKSQKELHDKVHNGVVRRHDAGQQRRPCLRRCRVDLVQHRGRTIRPNEVHKIDGAAVDEALDGKAKAGDGAVVVVHHRVSEGEQHEEVEKPPHAEPGLSVRRCKRLLYAEPDQHDGCEREDDVNPHRSNRGCRRGCERLARLSDKVEETCTHVPHLRSFFRFVLTSFRLRLLSTLA